MKTEEWLDQICDASFDPFVIHENGILIKANKLYFDVLGYSPEELIGKNILSITVAPESIEFVKKQIINDDPVNYELVVLKKDGTKFPVEVNTRFMEYNGRKVRGGSIRDITERKRAEGLLIESEEKYRAQFDELLDGFVMAEVDTGIIVDCNEAQLKLLGRKRSELIGKHQRIMHPPEDAEGEFSKTFKQHLKEKHGQLLETRVIAKNGEIKDVSIKANMFEFRGKKYLQGIFRDITERKKDHEMLLNNEEKFRILASLAPTQIYLTDKEGKCVFVNKAWSIAMGLSNEEAMGDGWRGGIHPDDREQVFANWHKMVDANGTWGHEYRTMNKNGKVCVVFGVAATIKDESGSITGYIGVNSDITDRKKAEEELKASRASLDIAQEIGGNSSWEWNIEKNTLFWSDNAYRMIGLKPNETVPAYEEFERLIHPDDRNMVNEEVKKALSGEKPYSVDARMINKDGREWIMHAQGTVYRNNDGKAVKFIGTQQDITDRKKAEEDLARYASIVSSSSDMMALLDMNYVYLAVNEACVRAFGKDKDEIVGRTASEVFGEEFFKTVIKPKAEQCLEGKEVRYEDWFNFPVYGKRYMLISYSPYMGLDKKQKGFVVIGSNITDRKKAEEEISLNSEIKKNINEGIYLIGLDDGIIKFANTKFESMFDYDPGELIGREVSIVNAPTEKTPKETKEQIIDILVRTRKWHGEVKNIKKDGTYFWCYANVSLFDHPAFGRVIVSVHTDITDRKKAEEELSTSKERLTLALKGADLGIWDYNVKTGYVVFSDRWVEMIGYKPGELKPDVSAWENLMHPDDKDEIFKALNRHLEDEKQEYRVEFRLKCKSGDWKWIQARGMVVERDESGKPIRMTGTHLDINESKKTEDLLKESRVLLQRAQEISHVGHFKFNPATGVVEGSDELFRIFGLSREEFQFSDFATSVRADQRDFVVSTIQSAIKGKTGYSIEHYLELRDGTQKYIAAIGECQLDKQGNVALLIGIVQDITERKKAEETIKTSLAEKEVLLKEVHHRVKNNLQLIVSLMRIQAGSTQDKTTLALFGECEERIMSIAQLYNTLNIAENKTSINFAQYTSNIVTRILSAHTLKDISITQVLRLKDMDFPIDIAIPCGLLINEIITNSMKHAFSGRQKGEVGVELAIDDGGRITLNVYDNGNGIPENIEFHESRSVGFTLIDLLAHQIKAEISISRENGTGFAFKFEIPSKKTQKE